MRPFLRPLILLTVLAGCGAPQTPPAQQYATISGTVADIATNKPIAGAVVTINGVQPSNPTGADGRYSVANIPNGDFSCSAQAPNYVPYQCGILPPLAPGEQRNLTIPMTHQ